MRVTSLRRRAGRAALAVALLGVLAGCGQMPPPLPNYVTRPLGQSPSSPDLSSNVELVKQPPLPSPAREVVVGRSACGRSVRAFIFDADADADCVLIIGGIHGNEPVASRLVEALIRHLERHPEDRCGRHIILIPRTNPDGLIANTRENARGVDLNRNFPADNFTASRQHGRAPLSEPVTRALVAVVARYRPARIVSVHGPLDCVDPDGPAASQQLARAMAAAGPLPYRDLEALPGSMGSYCGEKLGLTMVTYELDRKSVPPAGLDEYLRPHIAPMLVSIR